MNIRRIRRWLGGVVICGLGIMEAAQPAMGADALPYPLEMHTTQPLPMPTNGSNVRRDGHASKEAIRASQYAMLRKRIQAAQSTASTPTTYWWEEKE